MDAPEVTFAFEGGPFLEFLPVVDLADGRLLGMEALVRWEHPTLGRLAPDQLFPRVEASGDIIALSHWVLTEACRLAIDWSPSVQLAVNCALSMLHRGDAARTVTTVLEATGIEPGRLTLEITEGTVADDHAFAELRALSSLGVQLAVDDVGTNWSSFEPLRRLAVNTVKIDGSFVAGLESTQGINRLVVETVIHMAHSLGMATIAEGVETARQVALIRGFDADAAQGFFFARPMSPEDATALATATTLPRFSRTEPNTMVEARATPPPEEHPAPAAVPAAPVPIPSVDTVPVATAGAAPVPDLPVVVGEQDGGAAEVAASTPGPSPVPSVAEAPAAVPSVEVAGPAVTAPAPDRSGSGSRKGAHSPGAGGTAGSKRSSAAKKGAKAPAARKAPARKRAAGPPA